MNYSLSEFWHYGYFKVNVKYIYGSRTQYEIWRWIIFSLGETFSILNKIMLLIWGKSLICLLELNLTWEILWTWVDCFILVFRYFCCYWQKSRWVCFQGKTIFKILRVFILVLLMKMSLQRKLEQWFVLWRSCPFS